MFSPLSVSPSRGSPVFIPRVSVLNSVAAEGGYNFFFGRARWYVYGPRSDKRPFKFRDLPLPNAS